MNAVLSLAFVALGNGFVVGECPPVTPSPDWKGDIAFPYDPFRRDGDMQDPGWIKFAIRTCDPTTVFFQDSGKYLFHHDFAAAQLPPFVGMSRADFDRVTLFAAGQQAVLGAVLMPPWGLGSSEYPVLEYGIQLVRNDPYAAQEVVDYVTLVRGHVTGDPGMRFFYFPTFEQLASARANAAFLEANGIIVSSTDRWIDGNRVHSPGWALGVLKFFPANEVTEAFRAGALTAADILLTDGIPADTPLVAGIVSLAAVTPNSHVVILANTFQMPLVHLALEADVTRARALVGRRIVLRAYPTYGVSLLETEGLITEEQAAEILALKRRAALKLSPIARLGSYGGATDALTPADVRYFGGKASNFGFLRRSIPSHSAVAAAISFDLWTEFLDQTSPWGNTLREHIAEVLGTYSYPPADMRAFADDMDALRELFKNDGATRFTAAHEAAIIALLQDPAFGFDPAMNIRFRSSTNVEDTEQFTGAGLYDSYSGCLADDLDGDTAGPCLCDPAEPKERGVFRAIRKVFASFYNDAAVLERLRFGVAENEVGMALLVHHSFPDAIELANGVATLTKQSWGAYMTLVTQLGAVPVTNPEQDAIPEEVAASVYGASTYVYLVRASNLVQLGATVMEWQKDYKDLTQLLIAVSDRYAAETGKTDYVLDFEYKKVAPEGRLEVKQVREIPQPDETPAITPFLLNQPAAFETFQGEAADVFGNHRLKSRWTFQTRSMWLTAENLRQSIYTRVSLEYTDACEIMRRSGLLAEFPSARSSFDGTNATDQWKFDDLANPRSYTLTTASIPTLVSAAECPILTVGDFGGGRPPVQVVYQKPVMALDPYTDPAFEPTPTTAETILLSPPLPPPGLHEALQARTFTHHDGLNTVTIETQFYWQLAPSGPIAGYTAPLTRWVQTVITGLTTAPITLRGYFSQTMRPQHHNFSESFVFEPRLEPGISPQTLEELAAKDIHLIYVHAPWGPEGESVVLYLGADEAGHACACATPRFIRGDANGDGAVDVSDPVFLLRHLFGAGDPPLAWRAGDGNKDETITIADPVYVLQYLFDDGAPPSAPFPDAGCSE
jgi:hypothetical protein